MRVSATAADVFGSLNTQSVVIHQLQ